MLCLWCCSHLVDTLPTGFAHCSLINVFPLFSSDLKKKKINEAEFSYPLVSLEDSSIDILQCTIFLPEPLLP